MMLKRIVDARADSAGRIAAVLFSGNKRFTPVSRAIGMAERRLIVGAHVVHPRESDPYLRTNHDSREDNNLEELARH